LLELEIQRTNSLVGGLQLRNSKADLGGQAPVLEAAADGCAQLDRFARLDEVGVGALAQGFQG
jgi:hypothetical protein